MTMADLSQKLTTGCDTLDITDKDYQDNCD